MKHTFIPSGVCSRQIDFELEDGVITDISVKGGCNGNLQGVCSLVKGMKADEVFDRLSGIKCGSKPTSCPDQIARAIGEATGLRD